MEIRTSARRHGVADADIHHAIDDGEVAIHAMKLRKAYERYLPSEGRS